MEVEEIFFLGKKNKTGSVDKHFSEIFFLYYLKRMSRNVLKINV